MKGAYVTPGLVDAHVHLYGFLNQMLAHPTNVARHAIFSLGQATAGLKGGITSMRCLGDGFQTDIAIRDAIDAGTVVGPRLRSAGSALTPTGGHGGSGDAAFEWVARTCDGEEGWRRGAREQIQAGADHMKAIVTGGAIGGARDVTGAVTVTKAELAAAAEVFHARGLPVVVHAGSPEGVRLALEVGATSVEHGYELDKRSAAQLAAAGCYLTPTLTVTHNVPSQLEDDFDRSAFNAARRADWEVTRAEERRLAHAESFQRALDAGVEVLVGSDSGPLPLSTYTELNFLARSGMDAWQVLRAATWNAAGAMDLLGDVGSIEVGKFADMTVFGSDPTAEIATLRDPDLVYLGGVEVFRREGLEVPALP
jgi:imidazolonepropionase-like amidohydrolase